MCVVVDQRDHSVHRIPTERFLFAASGLPPATVKVAFVSCRMCVEEQARLVQSEKFGLGWASNWPSLVEAPKLHFGLRITKSIQIPHPAGIVCVRVFPF